MAKDVKIPDIGDSEGVEIIEILVAEGDSVEAEDSLITLESDKAAMDVPAPFAGTVKALKVKEGDKVSEGDVIMSVDEAKSDDGDEDDSEQDEEQAEAKDDSKKQDEEEADEQEGEPDEATEDEADGEDRKASSTEGSEEESNQEKSGGGVKPVEIPDIGGFEGVEVIEVLAEEGDTLEAEDSLITLESDKAAMDVPAPFAGTLKKLRVKAGDKVSEGDVIADIETTGGDEADGKKEKKKPSASKQSEQHADSKQASDKKDEKNKKGEKDEQGEQGEKSAKSKQSAGKKEPEKAPSASGGADVDSATQVSAHAGPSVRKLARELGVDLSRVEGSARKGRITHNDVKLYVKSALHGGAGAAGLPAVPEVDYSRFGEVETKPLSRIKRISGPRLQASWVNAPHVTQHDEADITALEGVRKGLNEHRGEDDAKLTVLAFLVRAVVLALKAFPEANSALDAAGENLIERKYYHIGFAVDTEGGLMVPVIHDADQLSVREIAAELARLAEAARKGKLRRKEMEGGCFSITSLGGIGGTAFTPIVNAPEVAILGVSRHEMKPKWNGSEFLPRLMLPLSLSYDHRVVDGALAARITRHLAATLESLRGFVS